MVEHPCERRGYVRGKDELLDAIVDAGMSEVELPEARGGWREQLRELAWASRRTLLRHPALVQIRLRRPILRPEAFKATEAGMRVLAEAGFPPAEAARAFRLLFVHTFGSAAFDVHESSPGEAARALAALPAEEYPAVHAAASVLPRTMGGDEQFAYDLERILDGLEARLPPPPIGGSASG